MKKRRKYRVIAGLAVTVALAAAPVAATHRVLGPGVEAAGWRLLTVPGKKAARFRVVEDGAIEIAADGAVAFLYRPGDDATGSSLAWRWRVDAAPRPGDLSVAGADDRPLAVHVTYPPPADAPLLDRAGRWLRGAVVGEPLTGRMVSYVWGGTAPRGTILANPGAPQDGVLIVLRDGGEPLGTWREEHVSPNDDYRAAFGAAPPAPVYIVVSADTDDLGGQSAGVVSMPVAVAKKSSATP